MSITFSGRQVLQAGSIVLDGRARDKDSAIDEAGRLLVAAGAVDEGYVTAMHDRERTISTYMGSLLSIPHGTSAAKKLIRSTALSFVRYPQGIDWGGGKRVEFVLGIAGVDDQHLELLANIAGVFVDVEAVERLRDATTAEDVLEELTGADS
ncbi:PTS sugar transporter subunit IIA [Raineyella sp. W15-4]|uniref:PTS sugar transporter subunit IIA n=1 Tax=Raineyella sp. W15-4 TaxID=3081651 RepID=UPI002954F320|nr:PTS sugar transporter subunit IIA [Raineyella sp. W15-4]WOQ17362.1 PTS sugar transporter subunit IIA [Raineyella sp. W15-4]